jgi:hypothetical protein
MGESKLPWVIPPKLWSNWDQTCAKEAGWHIYFDANRWIIAQCRTAKGIVRFDSNEHARDWVSKQADNGSKRHIRAIRALIAANISGHRPMHMPRFGVSESDQYDAVAYEQFINRTQRP